MEFLTYDHVDIRVFGGRGAGKISAIGFFAGVSAVALVCSLVYKAQETIHATSWHPQNSIARDSTSSVNAEQNINDIAKASNVSPFDAYTYVGARAISQVLGSYTSLQEQGAYTEEKGAEEGLRIASTMQLSVPAKTYSAGAIKLDLDGSAERVALYHSQLQSALAPLSANKEAEFEPYKRYVETGDTKNLDEISQLAKNYRAAVDNLLVMTVPADSLGVHVALANALEQFSATLDAMVKSTADPYASAALLVNYNRASDDLRNAFNGVATYFQNKNI